MANQVYLQWHKLASNLKSPPLKVNGNMVEDTLEKAEALRTEVLERFSADDDLGAPGDDLNERSAPSPMNVTMTAGTARLMIGASRTCS